MANPGETFSKGIYYEPQYDERPQIPRYRSQKERREYQQGYRHEGKDPSFLYPYESSGYGAVCGPGVPSVYAGVDNAVQGHAGGAGADHGDRDPEEVAYAKGDGRGKHSGVGEGQGEDGVLPFNHLKQYPELAGVHTGACASRGGYHNAPTSCRRASLYPRSSLSSPATRA